MPEYESSTYMNIIERTGERKTALVVALLALVALTASYYYYGGGVWLTQLAWYAAGTSWFWAVGEVIMYRYALSQIRRHPGSVVVRLHERSFVVTDSPDDAA